MASQDGGESSPPPSPSASFRKLVTACTKKASQGEPSSFVRRLEDIPEINLPPEQPMKVAISLSERGLVGQFMGLWPSTRTTDNWIQWNWRPLIQNSVTCYAVGRGYFIFEFISQEDRDLIFRNVPYFMGAQGLYLNRWTPNFDPASKVPKDVPVWVRLPNLPIHYWNSPSLQAIGNGLGHYIDKADPKDQYSCARICVEVDLEVGLPEVVKLKVGEWHHLQKLDYEQFSFKCRGCHEYGHFQRNCPKALQEKEKEEGWQQPRKGRSKPSGPRRDNPTSAPSNPRIQHTTNSFKELGNEGEAMPSSSTGQDEEGRKAQNQEVEGTSKASEGVEIGGTQGTKEGEIPPSRNEVEQGNEEGEISSWNETEGTSEAWDTPKRPSRGRKSRKAEREKEMYKNILQGAQPTLKQVIEVRQTRKQAKAFQGGHSPPQINQ
jgi:hypothetical protein